MGVTALRHADHALARATVYALVVWNVVVTAVVAFQTGGADAFNETSHFMGTNPLIQYILQPVLLFGVLFHLGMGIYLDLQNKKA